MSNTSENDKVPAVFPSDRDLLRRFIHDGDEPSFAAIVERHAALVMSVCRRVVGQSPDVDDAFQATFFALSQRPASIYECRSLSGWLYSVAWRTSVRLVRLRKRTMTQPLPDQVPASEPDPLDVIAQANDLASLDDELNQLPQKYRDVLVMSYFSQQTNQEIADQLNESKGAIDGRIRDARRMLRVRLARRGVEVGVLAVATAYVQSTATAASPALIQKAISLGAPGLVSQELAALNAAEVTQMKFLTSTGVPLMSKIGLTITAGLVLATGLWGMTKLAALPDGVAGGGAAAVLDATAEDAAKAGEIPVELSGQTGPAATTEAGGGVVSATAASAVLTLPVTVSGMIGPEDGSGVDAGDRPTAKPRRKPTGAAAEFSRGSERDAERKLNEFMQTQRVPALNYSGDEPLGNVLEFLASQLTDARGESFVFTLDQPQLSVEIPYSGLLADLQVRDLVIPEGSMTIGSALDHILSQVCDNEDQFYELTWIAKDELLLITTKAAAKYEENLFLRSYDISRLREISQLTTRVGERTRDPLSGGMGGGGGGFFRLLEPTQAGGGGTSRSTDTPPAKSQNPDATTQQPVISWEAGLMQTIQDLTAPPCQWYDIDGEGGKVSIAGNRLLVRQSRKGHEQVVAVLEQLELAAEDAIAEKAGTAQK